MEIEGPGAEALDNEAGGHRIQRIPPTERRGRVHTSTVTVAVLTEAQVEAQIGANDFKVEWYSGSGAGGQHRNKHQNSCRITHVPTGIVRKAETRHRESSYRMAMSALASALAEKSAFEAKLTQNGMRRQQVGAGMRGDKRRTYRFQEDIVHDHITGRRARCSEVLRGSFEKLW